MMLALTLFLSSIGLGHLLAKATGLQKMYGFQAAMGFALIPIFVFVLHLLFKQPLDLSAQITASIAMIGVLFHAWSIRENLRGFFEHPLILWGLPLTIFFLLFGPINYTPTATDELSHWLTMPRQMFIENALLSLDFTVKDFLSYTPGWPILNLYSDLIFSKYFNYSQALYVSFFSSIVCIVALYDLLKEFGDNLFNLKKYVLPLTVVVGIILIRQFAPRSAVIETPMYHAILLFFTTAGIIIKQQNRTAWFVYLSIIMAFSYLLKHTYITLIPLLLLIALLSFKLGFKKVVERALILLTPIILVYLTWKISCGGLNIQETFSATSVSSIAQLKSILSERIAIIHSFPKEFFLLFSFLPVLSQFAFVWFFVGRNRIDKRLFYLLIVYFILYLVSLIWMYFTAFGTYEALNFASFRRYMSIPLVPILFIGALNLIESFNFSLMPKIKNRLFKRFGVNFSARTSLIQNDRLVLLFCALFLCFTYNFGAYSADFKTHLMFKEFPKLKSVIFESSLIRPKVLVVAQGGVNFEFQLGRFLSIGDTDYLYEIAHSGTSFYEEPIDIWRSVKTSQGMKVLLYEANIIWMVKSDAWMDQILETILPADSCPQPYDLYFIRRIGRNFECIRKI